MGHNSKNKLNLIFPAIIVLIVFPWLLFFIIPFLIFVFSFYINQEKLKKAGKGPGGIVAINQLLKSFGIEYQLKESSVDNFYKTIHQGNRVSTKKQSSYKSSHSSDKQKKKTDSVSIYNSRKVDPYTIVVPDKKVGYTSSNFNKNKKNYTKKKPSYSISDTYKTKDNSSIWDDYHSVLDMMKK